MSDHYCASDYREWDAAGLQEFGDYSECIEYVNQEEDYCDSLCGEWFYPDDDNMTIYYGTFSNSHSPGASHYTYADVFSDEREYRAAVDVWEKYPEYIYTDLDEDLNDDDDDDDDDDDGYREDDDCDGSSFDDRHYNDVGGEG